jgi:hypothetical protein
MTLTIADLPGGSAENEGMSPRAPIRTCVPPQRRHPLFRGRGSRRTARLVAKQLATALGPDASHLDVERTR